MPKITWENILKGQAFKFDDTIVKQYKHFNNLQEDKIYFYRN